MDIAHIPEEFQLQLEGCKGGSEGVEMTGQRPGTDGFIPDLPWTAISSPSLTYAHSRQCHMQ